jgi:NAD-dependent deacetylase
VATGAGISTASGISDFRGPDGIWTRNPEAERRSTISYYLESADLRREVWRRRANAEGLRPSPNAGHHALLTLERTGRLDLLATQNTDGLHLEVGHRHEQVVELHGSARHVACVSCGSGVALDEVLERVRSGEDDPRCRMAPGGRTCTGLLKTTTVLFGERLDPERLRRAFASAERCDLLLAIGSTLTVYPVAELVPTVARRGAPVVIVNGAPTRFDALAEVVVDGDISDVVPAILVDPALGK